MEVTYSPKQIITGYLFRKILKGLKPTDMTDEKKNLLLQNEKNNVSQLKPTKNFTSLMFVLR